MRVVSLVPSVTETLLAWGVEPVACTRFCEQPALREVGGTKNPEIDAIVELAPDLVVMCDEENRREDWEALTARGVAVHSCSPRAVDEVVPALAALGDALDLVIEDGFAGGPVPPPEHLGVRAFVPIWRRPWMSIGRDTYGASVLAAMGVDNVLDGSVSGSAGGSVDRYPEVTLDAVRSLAPDVVLAPSEPYSFRPAHLAELATIAPVVAVDGQDLFWWGTRTPQAVARLHAAVVEAFLRR